MLDVPTNDASGANVTLPSDWVIDQIPSPGMLTVVDRQFGAASNGAHNVNRDAERPAPESFPSGSITTLVE